jgi:predicted transposase/invertase (TIGR01784 family)
MKYKWDNKNVLDYAVKEGIEKGIAEGMEKGKRENAITIAKEMKKEGMPLAQISEFTKLSIEEIEKL